MQSQKINQTDELLRAAQQARGTDTVEQLRWHDLAHYSTPCSDRSVLCWAEGAWQPGWFEPEAGWLDCVTGDRLQGVTHWSEPNGPQGLRAADEVAELREQKDGAYLERNRCVALIARMAIALGLRVAVSKTPIEGWSEDWHGCIYIELPTGQVSWHFHASQAHLFEGLPHRPATWDGHDTPLKYERVANAYRFTLPPAADGSA